VLKVAHHTLDTAELFLKKKTLVDVVLNESHTIVKDYRARLEGLRDYMPRYSREVWHLPADKLVTGANKLVFRPHSEGRYKGQYIIRRVELYPVW
jgi:hypothetical protein